jgi:hypothetical protein
MSAPTPKMLAALETLRRQTKNPDDAECLIRLDRAQGMCDQDPTYLLMGVAGFHGGASRPLRRPMNGAFQPYGRAQWFHSLRSEAKFVIESERRERFLSPYRLTFVADDSTGLLPREVFSALEVVPNFQLTMAEVAIDFPEGMDRDKVRRHGLFGKSRPAPSVEGTDYWGTRKGAKLVRCYFKHQIQAFRVELEMRPRFLKYHGVRDVFGFHKLATILPSRHIHFGTLNEQKLISRLKRMGLSARREREVLRVVAAMDGDLWPILNYLRNDVQMANTKRLVDPMPVNQIIADALGEWARMWPKGPKKL